MKFEQTEFGKNFGKNEKDAEQNSDQSKIENDYILLEKNDGLDFNCEYCMDREGGCAQCGFGKNR